MKFNDSRVYSFMASRPAKAARSGPLPEDMDSQVSLITCSGELADHQVRLIVKCDEQPCFSCVRQIGEAIAMYAHENEFPVLSCDPESLDDLEDYDASLLEDHFTDQDIASALCRVLLPETAAETEYPGQSPTKLTTKMVRAWRMKEVENKAVWCRRSRYVARENAFLAERSDLFSPASTSLSNRVLPALYLQRAQEPREPQILCFLDSSDAYLSVKQTRLALVCYGDRKFVVGRLLPGQPVASKEWYLDFSSHLDSQLSLEKCRALPSLA